MIAIFDLDGVITGEQIYWDSAGQALAKLLDYPVSSIPVSLIVQIKSMAINSNWDLAYILYCCESISQSHRRLDEARILSTLRGFAGHRGFDLLREVGAEADRCDGDGRFAYRGAEYQRVHRVCQEIHESRLADENSRELDMPAVPLEELRGVLEEMQAQGIALGVASGRSRREATRALMQFGIEGFFEPDRMVFHDDIVVSEADLARDGKRMSLTKPHPFSILRAARPEIPIADVVGSGVRLDDTVYIGDTVSDVLAAKAAGAFSIGVLTGMPEQGTLRAARKKELIAAGCDHVVVSVLELPEALAAFSGGKYYAERLQSF